MRRVDVRNVTKGGILLLSQVGVAEGYVERLKGLMGKQSLEQGTGLLLSPCNSIHTFFMRFPIDVAFLDRDSRVCHIIYDMKAGRVSPILHQASCVLETNSGLFSDDNIAIGDLLEFKPIP